MSQKAVATIAENIEIARGVFRLVLSDVQGADGSGACGARLTSPVVLPKDVTVADIAAAAVPGQFVNVYLNNESMLLPRPFGISDVESFDGERRLVLVYAIRGAGTAELASYVPGTEIRVLGPNGNGYDLEGLGRHVLLVGGGLGIPPLLFVARRTRESSGPYGRPKITAILGYSEDAYYSEAIHLYCDDVFGISESRHLGGGVSYGGSPGTVMDLIDRLVFEGKLDVAGTSILSCGPIPMLRAVSEWAVGNGIPAQVSLEARMGCGYGACVGCTIDISVGAPTVTEDCGLTATFCGTASSPIVRRKVCKDGPVFPSDTVIW
ncbi:MAG: dihydroorotate dehydrogenase electron transfer subunit [Clostridiales Family XIII bacterium]|nr:dihydroorotate dehydrogenase electron transfer subunit [Clostridiales Family XIII bacterium]